MNGSLYFTRAFIILRSLLLLAILSGCGNGGGTEAITRGGPSSADGDIGTETSAGSSVASGGTNTTTTGSLPAAKRILTWDAPTLYSDGTYLAPGDIKEYRIYFSVAPGSYSSGNYYTVSAPTTSVNVKVLNLPELRIYFVVTAVDTSNRESAFSEEVNADLANFS